MGLAALPVPDPAVRDAAAGDAADLERLFSLAREELADRKGAWLWERSDSPFSDLQDAVRSVLNAPWITVVGSIDNVIVGYLIAEQKQMHADGDIGVVRGLYVEEGARDVGVGDALIMHALDRFKDAGCVGVDSWALPGERDTKNFYEAHGFSARTIVVHHSFIEPKHVSRTEGLKGAFVRDDSSLSEADSTREAGATIEADAS